MMTTRTHHTGLAAIAVLKMVKGALLFLGLGLLKLVHAEIATFFSLLIEAFISTPTRASFMRWC